MSVDDDISMSSGNLSSNNSDIFKDELYENNNQEKFKI